MIRIHDLECRNPVDSNPISSPWNMIGEVVLEEVPRLLSSNREHCDQVCRIHSVSQKLEPDAWCSRHCFCVRLHGKRQPIKRLIFLKDFGRKRLPCQPMFGALEYSSVGVAAKVLPLDFANHPHWVD